jgi:hypothetical protein
MYAGKCSNIRSTISSYQEHGSDKLFDNQAHNTQSVVDNLIMTNTKRLAKLNLSKLYCNHDGSCRGAVRYFLEGFANAYQNIEEKSRLKDKLIYSLELQEKNIMNNQALSKISEYQNSSIWNQTTLKFAQSIHSNGNSISKTIIDMIQLMKLNNLDSLFSEIFTYEHALAFIIFRNRDEFKFTYYDPSNGIYSKITLNQEKINLETISTITKSMDYLVNNPQLYLYVKCYSLNTTMTTTTLEQPCFQELPQDIKYQQQLLILAIEMEDYSLVRDLLNLTKLNLKFKCNNVTPISVATANQNEEIIKLLAAYDPDIVNYLDQKGYSPLGIAIYKKDVTTAKLLLELGALVDFPKGKLSPLKISEFYKCLEVDQLLRNYTPEAGCSIL